MTPEEKSLLERTYKMTEENNTILKGIRRSNRIGVAMKILYWVIIIGATVGAFYFIQPYINSMMGIVDEAQSAIQGVKSTTSQAQDAFNKVRYGN